MVTLKFNETMGASFGVEVVTPYMNRLASLSSSQVGGSLELIRLSKDENQVTSVLSNQIV